jgi:hypothetical protein
LTLLVLVRLEPKNELLQQLAVPLLAFDVDVFSHRSLSRISFLVQDAEPQLFQVVRQLRLLVAALPLPFEHFSDIIGRHVGHVVVVHLVKLLLAPGREHDSFPVLRDVFFLVFARGSLFKLKLKLPRRAVQTVWVCVALVEVQHLLLLWD